jgi:hypothetical protein
MGSQRKSKWPIREKRIRIRGRVEGVFVAGVAGWGKRASQARAILRDLL